MADFGCSDLTVDASKKYTQQYSNIDFDFGAKALLFQGPSISFDIPHNKKPVASPRVIKDPVGNSLPMLESSLSSEDN